MPSEETTQLVQLVTRCYSEGYDSKVEQNKTPSPFPGGGEISNPDRVYHDAYMGDLWKYMGFQPNWKSRPVNNLIMPAVENYVTFITDNAPSPSIAPREDKDIFLASIVRAGVDYWWDAESMQMKVTQAVRGSSISSGGLSWLYAPFDGRQKCEVIHNESIIVDPECTAENFDPSYLVYEYRASFGNLKEAYPKAAWDEYQDGWTPTTTKLIDRVQTRFKQVFDTSIKSPLRTVSVYELWIKDTSKEEFTDEIDTHIIRRKKAKYPNGWRVIVFSGGIVLSDKPSPYKHGQLPFTPVFCYTIPGRLQGMGHVQALLPMQVQHMKVSQILIDQTVKSSGGIYLLGAGLDLDKAAITNAPVQVHNVRDVNQFRVVEPPGPARHLFNFLEKIESMSRDVVGQHDISVGKQLTGNTTAQEVNAISQNDKTRVRSISRSLAWSLERVLRQVVSNLAQFEDKSWFLRIAGDDGSEESVEFVPSKMLRRLSEEGDITEDVIEFDLKIDDSSMLPDSANELMAQAINLFDRQALSKQTLMKILKVPNPKQEIMLLNEEQQAAQPAEPAMPEGAEGAAPVDPNAMPPELMAQVEAMASEQGLDPQEVVAAMSGAV